MYSTSGLKHLDIIDFILVSLENDTIIQKLYFNVYRDKL